MIEDPRSESLKQHAEERFQLLVDSVKDYAIFMLDTEGCVMTWNAGARRIKGYKAEEIIGSHFSRFYTPEDIQAQKPERELATAIAEGRVEDEGWRLRKDGSRFWVNVVITPLRDPVTNELRGFGKVTRDLTERKRAEEELRHNEEQFRLLVDGVTEYAIFMLDPTGRIATWNSGAERAKGYTAAEIIGEKFTRFYTPEDQASGKPFRLLKEAEEHGSARDQGPRVRKDGCTFMADVLITAIYDEDHRLRGFTKITRDITDQVRTREMEAARLAAEKMSKAKDEFLAVLSHELRTPLSPAVAGLSYLAENATTLSREELLEVVGTIRRNILLEAQLIDDLLDLTRISRSKIDLHCEAVDLHGVLHDVLGICEQDISGKHLVVSSALDASEHWVWADPTRIRQVFWNLLTNAVKFTPEGGYISILSYNGEAGQLLVEVSDTGVGIEPDQVSRIFNAFEQGERTVTRQFGGLGLGLTITRSLVEMHRGTISVQSKGRGKGASFRVTLQSVPHRITETQIGSHTPVDALPGLRILLVDDHEDTRRIFSRLLIAQGHQVEVASCVKDALARLEAGPFDILISDIGLPDGSGHELMEIARTQQAQLKGIALSGFGMEDDVRRSLDAGFEYHLTKPVDISVLRELLVKISSRENTPKAQVVGKTDLQ